MMIESTARRVKGEYFLLSTNSLYKYRSPESSCS